MNDLGVDLHALRADFRTVREWFVECGEWTEAEADEIGQAIKAAVELPDLGMLAFWAEWMTYWASLARAHTERMAYLNQAASAWAREQGRKAA